MYLENLLGVDGEEGVEVRRLANGDVSITLEIIIGREKIEGRKECAFNRIAAPNTFLSLPFFKRALEERDNSKFKTIGTLQEEVSRLQDKANAYDGAIKILTDIKRIFN